MNSDEFEMLFESTGTLDVRIDLIRLVGINCAVVLSEIISLGDRAVAVERDGKTWYVVPRSYWEDSLGMSRNSADYALKKLCEIGLLERERFPYGGGMFGGIRYEAKMTTHIRLPDNFEEIVASLAKDK